MNTNCMQGLRCPAYKQEAELLVWATMCVSLTDDGTDPHADSVTDSEVAWDDDSHVECPECDWSGCMREVEEAD